jgi:hypothetical protein
VNGELWKLGKDEPAPRANRGRRLVIVGIIGLLLICGGTGMLIVRVKSSRNAAAVRGQGPQERPGLRILDTKVPFAAGTIQKVDLRLPCSGLLSLNVTFPKETCLSVFLVPPEELAKMETGQTFKHVPGLDAKTTSGSYRRAAKLPAGRYSLVLLDESGSRSAVDVKAHLGDLK